VLLLLGLLFFTGLAGLAWVISQIPLPSEARLASTSVIYDASGQPLAELHGTENRFPVELTEVPRVVQDAVIAAEDRNFLSHGGVDPVGILRATWADIRAGSAVEGGSTITQQYVKNTLVGSERSLVRKLKEAVVAVKLERKYDKRTILEKYLNTVYFGRGAYGVQAASQAYFGRDVGELGLREAAYLAGLIRAPSAGDVAIDAPRAAQLRASVLDAMVDTAAITQAQADAVRAVPLESYVFAPTPADATFINPTAGSEYFVDYVRRQLVATYGEDRVLRGGLRVETSLDPAIQSVAYDAVYGTLDPDDPATPDAALVALDRDGRVVAMVGGRSWRDSQVNLAVGAEGGGSGRQAGSAFKPLALAEKLAQGGSLDATYPAPATIVLAGADNGADWEVSNYDKAGYGRLSLLDATVVSSNTVYAQLALEVGPEAVARLATQMGIDGPLEPTPSIVLGTQNTSVLDMAGAYLTFGNDGTYLEPRVIRTVSDETGPLVEDQPAGARRVLDPDVARQVREALTQVVERGSGRGARLPGPAWGKTGTTEDYGDAWFLGGNDELVVGVWMGHAEGQSIPMLNVGGVPRVAGGTWPAAIFRKFMTQVAPGDGRDHPAPRISGQEVGGTPVAGEIPAPATTSPSLGTDATSPPTTHAPAPAPTTPPSASPTTRPAATPGAGPGLEPAGPSGLGPGPTTTVAFPGLTTPTRPNLDAFR